MPQSALDAVAWTRFQPRTSALAAALGGHARFLDDGAVGSHVAIRPLSYLVKAFRTWKLLSRDNPKTVLVITPPVFAPMVAWLWCLAHGRPLVVDCHTGAFHSQKWAWARPIHRWLLRRVRVVLLHTDELEELVSGWGARAMVLPDDLPTIADASPQAREERRLVLIAGSFDSNEPVAAVVEAARLLPGVDFHFTGNPDLLSPKVRAEAPDNALFTGDLAYPVFLGELLAADVVGVFSTDPRIMNRAAFEAVGLGRPLVLSDLPALKERFGGAALFAPNDPPAMAAAMNLALDSQEELAARSVALQSELRGQRDAAVARLKSILHNKEDGEWRLNAAS